MNHAPADYVNAGHKYESARSLDAARAQAQRSTDDPVIIEHLEKWNGVQYAPVGAA